jgi:tetratricopeptide (TPR) repeat protein
MVADELARWGDWRDAIWIWESVLSSRPYVVAIISNVARGYATLGDMDKAMDYLHRAEKIQPHAPAVRSLQVILYSRMGDQAKALEVAREAIAANIYDHELVNASFGLAARAGDYELAAKAMHLQISARPESSAQGYLQLGNMYAMGARDRGKALDAFKHALALTPAAQRDALLPHIPPDYRGSLGLPAVGPGGAKGQTSASKG